MRIDNFLHKLPKSDLYAAIGTIISGIIILLILLFVLLPGLQQDEDGGIMISFGDAYTGGGSEDMTTQLTEETSPPTQEVKDEMMTQQDESAYIPDTKDRQEEQARLEAERLRKEQELAQQTDELMGGLFGSSSDAGSGQTSGDTPAGNPVGKGSMDGNSWSLDGRDLLGTMPRPQYTKNIEGSITVEILVNEAGKVVSATIKRSIISDASIRDAAVNAAKRTNFSSGRNMVVGTITYNFKLK